jgi:uncharacterized protein (DUF885 family)
MKRIIIVLLTCFTAFAGSSQTKDENMKTPFSRFKTIFVDKLWRMYPEWASGQGYHKYDSVLIPPTAAARQGEIKFAETMLQSMKKFPLAGMDGNNLTDYYIIQNFLNGLKWRLQEEKAWEWNPSQYNVSEVFSLMLNNEYEPLEKRLHNLNLRLARVPQYYSAAMGNIKNPTKEHTQLAIDQNLGGLSVFTDDLETKLAASKLPDQEKALIRERSKAAVAAINGYADWLRNLNNDKPRSFRLGKDLYQQKFNYDIVSRFTVDEIYERAVNRKKELHEKMFSLADKLWNKYMGSAAKPGDRLKLTRAVIDKISLKHATAATFQEAIEKQVPLLAEFIKKKDLIYLDPSKPLVIRKEPAYMAGVAGASINAPGPYDKEGNTYYNVGSLANWDSARAESYLREYNSYTMQVLNIHEAIPGHYTQLIYSNQSPSIIKSILGNNTMIEGWAVYAELMMLENGYGAPAGSNDPEPEMWLMYYKWHLRSVCNTILDHDVHTANMTKDEAMNLLVNEAFQQQAEAEGKWRRVNVTQVQLACYFTGFTEIYELREEMKAKLGSKFNLKEFHEKFLSYGSAPVKYIREMMTKEVKG